MQKENDFRKWLLPIVTGLLFSICSVVFGFVISDIANNTKKIEEIQKKDKTEVILTKIEGLIKYIETRFKAIEDKID